MKSKIMYLLSGLVVVVLIAGGALKYVVEQKRADYRAEQEAATRKAAQRYESVSLKVESFLASINGKEDSLSLMTNIKLQELEKLHRQMNKISPNLLKAEDADEISDEISAWLTNLTKQVSEELEADK